MRTLADPVKPPMRYRVVDADFAAVLEEHFGIPTCVMLTALEGESRSRAVALCRWASRNEEPTRTLLMLARKFGRGRARRRRTPAAPPRGHVEVSPRPTVDRLGPGWGCSRPQRDGCPLRGLCDPDALARTTARPVGA